MTTHPQTSPYASPWSWRTRAAMFAWECVWGVCCRWTPAPANFWRLLWLRLFRARIAGRPFVHPRARIRMPWHVTLHHRACLGDRSHLYALDTIVVGAGATIAQEAYLCTGSHDFNELTLPLKTAPIVIGPHAFVGLRAIVLPGAAIGEGAVVGAGSVVTHAVEPGTIVAGNPAAPIGRRPAQAWPPPGE